MLSPPGVACDGIEKTVRRRLLRSFRGRPGPFGVDFDREIDRGSQEKRQSDWERS